MQYPNVQVAASSRSGEFIVAGTATADTLFCVVTAAHGPASEPYPGLGDGTIRSALQHLLHPDNTGPGFEPRFVQMRNGTACFQYRQYTYERQLRGTNRTITVSSEFAFVASYDGTNTLTKLRTFGQDPDDRTITVQALSQTSEGDILVVLSHKRNITDGSSVWPALNPDAFGVSTSTAMFMAAAAPNSQTSHVEWSVQFYGDNLSINNAESRRAPGGLQVAMAGSWRTSVRTGPVMHRAIFCSGLNPTQLYPAEEFVAAGCTQNLPLPIAAPAQELRDRAQTRSFPGFSSALPLLLSWSYKMEFPPLAPGATVLRSFERLAMVPICQSSDFCSGMRSVVQIMPDGRLLWFPYLNPPPTSPAIPIGPITNQSTTLEEVLLRHSTLQPAVTSSLVATVPLLYFQDTSRGALPVESRRASISLLLALQPEKLRTPSLTEPMSNYSLGVAAASLAGNSYVSAAKVYGRGGVYTTGWLAPTAARVFGTNVWAQHRTVEELRGRQQPIEVKSAGVQYALPGTPGLAPAAFLSFVLDESAAVVDHFDTIEPPRLLVRQSESAMRSRTPLRRLYTSNGDATSEDIAQVIASVAFDNQCGLQHDCVHGQPVRVPIVYLSPPLFAPSYLSVFGYHLLATAALYGSLNSSSFPGSAPMGSGITDGQWANLHRRWVDSAASAALQDTFHSTFDAARAKSYFSVPSTHPDDWWCRGPEAATRTSPSQLPWFRTAGLSADPDDVEASDQVCNWKSGVPLWSLNTGFAPDNADIFPARSGVPAWMDAIHLNGGARRLPTTNQQRSVQPSVSHVIKPAHRATASVRRARRTQGSSAWTTTVELGFGNSSNLLVATVRAPEGKRRRLGPGGLFLPLNLLRRDHVALDARTRTPFGWTSWQGVRRSDNVTHPVTEAANLQVCSTLCKQLCK